MRAGLLYLCLVFVLSVLGFSCQRKSTKTKPASDTREQVIKTDGALQFDSQSTKAHQTSELIFLPNPGQDLLLINFQTSVKHRQKQEKVEVNLRIPIDATSGLPAPGEYLFYNNGEGHVRGDMAYSISENNNSYTRTDCHFRLTTLILRIEESTENSLEANLLMTARQMAGSQRISGKTDDLQLADSGWVQLHAHFAAPVYNLPKVQKRTLI